MLMLRRARDSFHYRTGLAIGTIESVTARAWRNIKCTFGLGPVQHLKNNGSDSRGRALLCYVHLPVRGQREVHSAAVMAQEIANSLSDHGWQVDVIPWHEQHLPRRILGKTANYDLVIGFGPLFESICKERSVPRRIHFATGAHHSFQENAELGRIAGFMERTGKLLLPRRTLDRVFPHSLIFSQRILLIGNSWTRSTYTTPITPITCIDPPTNIHRDETDPPGAGNQWNGIIWFGSPGMLHKGLDLLIEAMAGLGPEVELHICGDCPEETDFWEHYSRLPSNIHRHGFVHPDSAMAKDLFRKCGFVALPSCSEGMSTGVLTCMATGLIPLVTRECGLDVEGIGYLIPTPTVEGVMTAIRSALAEPRPLLAQRSLAAIRRVQERHSRTRFREQIVDALGAEGVIGRGARAAADGKPKPAAQTADIP